MNKHQNISKLKPYEVCLLQLFDGVTWGTKDVCDQILHNLQSQGMTYYELCNWDDIVGVEEIVVE